MHAWQCRHCDARNAAALIVCHGCGSARATAAARTIAKASYRPPGAGRIAWEMLRTTLWVAVALPFFLVVTGAALMLLGGVPVAGAVLLLLGAAVWYLAKIAGAVSR